MIRLEILKGASNWRLTDLARASKVSRPLIYYYFGKSKEEIIHTAVDFLGEEYFGLSERRFKKWKEGKLIDSILETRRMAQHSPFVHVFYTTRRHLDNEVGIKLRDFEKRFRLKISQFFPQLSKAGNDGMAAVLFGLVAFPDLTDEGVEQSLKAIMKAFTFQKG